MCMCVHTRLPRPSPHTYRRGNSLGSYWFWIVGPASWASWGKLWDLKSRQFHLVYSLLSLWNKCFLPQQLDYYFHLSSVCFNTGQEICFTFLVGFTRSFGATSSGISQWVLNAGKLWRLQIMSWRLQATLRKLKLEQFCDSRPFWIAVPQPSL